MEYLTTRQAAEVLGITQKGVGKLIERGKLTAEKVGRDLLIRRADVERAKSRPGRGRPKLPPAGEVAKKRGRKKP